MIGRMRRPDLPSGTVTFLFTDVEGSTRLLQELGERYQSVLTEHHQLIRDLLARHGLALDRAAWRETQRRPQTGAGDLRFDFVLYERA